MLLRARSDDDLGATGAVVERANESFLVTPGELGAFVAVDDHAARPLDRARLPRSAAVRCSTCVGLPAAIARCEHAGRNRIGDAVIELSSPCTGRCVHDGRQ